jgi:hypothetical protein
VAAAAPIFVRVAMDFPTGRSSPAAGGAANTPVAVKARVMEAAQAVATRQAETPPRPTAKVAAKTRVARVVTDQETMTEPPGALARAARVRPQASTPVAAAAAGTVAAAGVATVMRVAALDISVVWIKVRPRPVGILGMVP